MLCTGRLSRTVGQVCAPQEAAAKGTGCQQLATGQTRLEQGLSALLFHMVIAQVSSTTYF